MAARPMMRAAWLLFAALWMASASAAPDGMPTPGSHWRYAYQDERHSGAERFFTVEVLGVEGQRVQERFSVEGGEITQHLLDANEMRFVARPISDSISVVELAPYAPELYKRVAAAPSGYPSIAGAVWKVGKATYAQERVTVRAGTFAALRVEVTGTSPAYGLGTTTLAQPARFTYTAWYSPEQRRYVKTRHQTWTPGGQAVSDEVVQLVTYQPGK